jgi:hypothetical protein
VAHLDSAIGAPASGPAPWSDHAPNKSGDAANKVLPTSRRQSFSPIPLPARCRQHPAVHEKETIDHLRGSAPVRKRLTNSPAMIPKLVRAAGALKPFR